MTSVTQGPSSSRGTAQTPGRKPAMLVFARQLLSNLLHSRWLSHMATTLLSVLLVVLLNAQGSLAGRLSGML